MGSLTLVTDEGSHQSVTQCRHGSSGVYACARRSALYAVRCDGPIHVMVLFIFWLFASGIVASARLLEACVHTIVVWLGEGFARVKASSRGCLRAECVCILHVISYLCPDYDLRDGGLSLALAICFTALVSLSLIIFHSSALSWRSCIRFDSVSQSNSPGRNHTTLGLLAAVASIACERSLADDGVKCEDRDLDVMRVDALLHRKRRVSEGKCQPVDCVFTLTSPSAKLE